MKEEQPIVYLIDDDQAVREGVVDLLRSVGRSVHSFGSVQEFMDSNRPEVPSCIVLDVRLPGMSGLEFQRSLIRSNIHIPVIFISGHADIPMTVRAIKSGAIDFLTKPVHEQKLLDTVQAAIEHDRARRKQAKGVAALRDRFDSLTPRERQIFTLMVSGRRNKQIAVQIGLSEMTVKVHRTHVMQKMRANTVIELVRMADQLGVSTAAS
jgi:FixJ family two-component response regulator